MGFLDKLKNVKDTLAAKAGEGVEAAKGAASDIKQKLGANEESVRQVLAVCATVAYADGDLSDPERRKIEQYLEATEFPGVKAERATEIFAEVCKPFSFDVNVGRQESMKVIEGAQNSSSKEDLVWVGCAIAASDDGIGDEEKKAIELVCNTLGIDVAKFDLDAD
jgi:tellurite resistance protein